MTRLLSLDDGLVTDTGSSEGNGDEVGCMVTEMIRSWIERSGGEEVLVERMIDREVQVYYTLGYSGVS